MEFLSGTRGSDRAQGTAVRSSERADGRVISSSKAGRLAQAMRGDHRAIRREGPGLSGSIRLHPNRISSYPECLLAREIVTWTE